MKIYQKLKTHIGLPPQKTDYIVGSSIMENIPDFNSFLLLSDKSVFSLHGKRLFDYLLQRGKKVTVSLIKPGENSKDLSTLDDTIKPFFATAIRKNTALIALGGGVVTDIGGFIASIILRGIPSIFIPTTLLSHVDAALGGKNGMNIKISGTTYKNMIGTISQPIKVLSDIDFLKTLTEREWRSGLGEIAKYTIGWGTPSLLKLKKLKLHKSLNSEELLDVISCCQKLKLGIIKKDPFDSLHIRESLNFGHTIGHALEGLSKGKLSHGQGVSLGIACASFISLKMGFISESLHRENISLLQSLSLPIKIKRSPLLRSGHSDSWVKNLNIKDVKSATTHDKKGGTFVLLKGKHKLESNIHVPDAIIDEALKEIII